MIVSPQLCHNPPRAQSRSAPTTYTGIVGVQRQAKSETKPQPCWAGHGTMSGLMWEDSPALLVRAQTPGYAVGACVPRALALEAAGILRAPAIHLRGGQAPCLSTLP